MNCKVLNCPCNKSEEWFVNSPEHENCFFQYMKNNKRSHTLSEIANLLGITISAVTATERKALSQLRKKLMFKVDKLK